MSMTARYREVAAVTELRKSLDAELAGAQALRSKREVAAKQPSPATPHIKLQAALRERLSEILEQLQRPQDRLSQQHIVRSTKARDGCTLKRAERRPGGAILIQRLGGIFRAVANRRSNGGGGQA